MNTQTRGAAKVGNVTQQQRNLANLAIQNNVGNVAQHHRTLIIQNNGRNVANAANEDLVRNVSNVQNLHRKVNPLRAGKNDC